MLEELTAATGVSALAIASMFFFVVVWLVIAVRVLRARPEDLEAQARLPLEGDTEDWQGVPSDAPKER